MPDQAQTIEIVDWLIQAGGPWIALAILWYENRRIWSKLDQCYEEICEQLTPKA